jgi:excinuclease UvrABC helicase subunit UvrB
MTESTKATRATVTIGNLAIDGFMLPDGGYRMSQTQAAEAVGLKVQNVSDFLRSKALKSLMGEGYTPQISEIEPDESQGRGGSRINAVPIEIVTKYWLWQLFRGNKKALALVDALTTETIERRFDAAFGVSRTEQERDDRLTSRIQQLEKDLTTLGDAFEVDNAQSLELQAYRDEAQRLRALLAENGITEN